MLKVVFNLDYANIYFKSFDKNADDIVHVVVVLFRPAFYALRRYIGATISRHIILFEVIVHTASAPALSATLFSFSFVNSDAKEKSRVLPLRDAIALQIFAK